MDFSAPREPLLTTAELAAELKISEQWVRDHAAGRRQPRIPAVRISGDVKLSLGSDAQDRPPPIDNLIEQVAIRLKDARNYSGPFLQIKKLGAHMARPRHQHGWLEESNGKWIAHWYAYVRLEDGKEKRRE